MQHCLVSNDLASELQGQEINILIFTFFIIIFFIIFGQSKDIDWLNISNKQYYAYLLNNDMVSREMR